MSSPVVLVDDEDRPLGTAEKRRAHQKGWLHRAFSAFVFDARGRLLLQKRAPNKYHSGGLWSNTCCSHPFPNEEPIDGARRRLSEEMGFDCPLSAAYQQRYQLPVGDDLVEHEFDHVFVGRAAAPEIHPAPAEVSDWAWVHLETLREDVRVQPHRYTVWFRLLLDSAAAAAHEILDLNLRPPLNEA